MDILKRSRLGFPALMFLAASTMSGQTDLTFGIYSTVRCDSSVASAPMRLDGLTAPVCLEDAPILTQTDVASAAANYGSDGKPALELALNSAAAQRFHDFTARSIGLQLGAVLNGRLVSVVTIAVPIAGLSLAGVSSEQANSVVNAVNNGSLSKKPPPALRSGGTGRGGGYAGPVIGGRLSPPSVIQKVEPEYTDAARAAGIQGTVILNILIHEDGTSEVVRVARSLDSGLDEKAIDCARQYRFKPATRDGAPVSIRATLEITFRL